VSGIARNRVRLHVGISVRHQSESAVIKTVINGMTFDGATTDPMQCAVRDALIAFMAATAQAQAEATKSAQRAGIDHKRRIEPTAYLGRKPSYTRQQLDRVLSALSSASAPSLSTIARVEGLTKQTVYRIKADPRAAEAALVPWGLWVASRVKAATAPIRDNGGTPAGFAAFQMSLSCAIPYRQFLPDDFKETV
jgi:Helix-turn-helix domain of resolvase